MNIAPDGSVYFLDEAQNIYRPRSSASKVPESVAAFEVHRHKGLDFFLITQNPRLIDANIRAISIKAYTPKTNVGRDVSNTNGQKQKITYTVNNGCNTVNLQTRQKKPLLFTNLHQSIQNKKESYLPLYT